MPYRHVYHGQLLGRELAVWRADDDFVNVWENRCLHRGVRLSIGSNDGTELRCQYHGWRYANRSAGCTYIPAHPADAPARTICNRTFPSVERYGVIWSGEDPVGEPPTIDVLEAGTPFGLRNLPVDAPVELTIQHLQAHRFEPSGRLDAESAEMSVDWADHYSVALTARAGGSRSCAVFFVQPVDSARCVIRGVLAETPPAGEHLAVLRHHATEMNALVAAIEAGAALLPAPEPMVPVLQQVPLRLAEKINPLGHIPVIDDDGYVLRDAHAILVYLAARYDLSGLWYPTGDAELIGETAQWMLFAEGTTNTASAARLCVNLGYDFNLEACQAGAHRLFRVLDEHLWFHEREGRDWVCSGTHPTIADIALFPDVMLSEEGGIPRINYPALRRWTDRVRRIPGFETMPGIFPASPG